MLTLSPRLANTTLMRDRRPSRPKPYRKVVSASVNDTMFNRLQDESEDTETTVSTIIRRRLKESYTDHPPEFELREREKERAAE